MKYNSATLAFMKAHLAKQRAKKLDSELLNRAICFQSPGFNLIMGEPYAGCTAVCLEIIESEVNDEVPVFYVDFNDAVYHSRLGSVDPSLVVIFKPHSTDDVINLAKEVQEEIGAGTFVLDGAHLIQDPIGVTTLAERIRMIVPDACIIATDRIHKPDELWGSKLKIEIAKKHYFRRELIGHWINMIGVGKQTHYISYTSGRLSKAYEWMTLQLEQGVGRGDVFGYKDLEVKGYNNFMLYASLKGY